MRILAAMLVIAEVGFAKGLPLEPWLTEQRNVSEHFLLANISPVGTLPGTVIASPSRRDPDYYYHWVRDAALVMLTLAHENLGGAANVRRHLFDFAHLTKTHQAKSGFEGLGEPKYYVNGDPYTLPWGRPQNDGPALRALVHIELIRRLIADGDFSNHRQWLYDGQSPSKSVLKMDLDYLVAHWSKPSFDLWEEVQGEHYYTLAVQVAALEQGAKLAGQLGDAGAARVYSQEAQLAKSRILNFRSSSQGWIKPTLHRVGGHEKHSDLDTAVLLGVLHSGGASDSYAEPWVMATLHKLKSEFHRIYSINHRDLPGVAFGRYPEDVYFGGNPWFLTTAAQAEIMYKMAMALHRQGKIEVRPINEPFLRGLGWKSKGKGTVRKGMPEFDLVLSNLKVEADAVLERIRFHVPADRRLTEQFNRDSGFVLGAEDLTWSYASFLSAESARREVQSVLGNP